MVYIKPYAPALVWGIFIFALSTWPGKDFPQLNWGDLLSVDKLVHIAFYAFLTGLILRGYLLIKKGKLKIDGVRFLLQNGQNKGEMNRFGFYVALGCTAYGWFLEWFQEHFCQDRLFDPFDGLANTIGAFAVLGLFIWQNRKNVA